MSGTELSTEAGGGELAAIETSMKSDIRAYFASPDLQARHRALIEAREAAAVPSILGDWHGGEAATVERARKNATAILGVFAGEPDKGRDFQDSFEGLPKAVQEACFAELSRYAPGYVKHADDAELAAIRDGLEGGAGLLDAWGWKAAAKLGRALDAIERVEKALSPDDRRQFQAWVARIPHRERVLLLWGAAG